MNNDELNNLLNAVRMIQTSFAQLGIMIFCGLVIHACVLGASLGVMR